MMEKVSQGLREEHRIWSEVEGEGTRPCPVHRSAPRRRTARVEVSCARGNEKTDFGSHNIRLPFAITSPCEQGDAY
jgi:hypothetical protein